MPYWASAEKSFAPQVAYEAFRAGLAEVQHLLDYVESRFLRGLALKCFELRVGGHYPGPGPGSSAGERKL